MDNKIKIKDIAITELIPYENNPRHNDSAVGPVMDSIKEFGFKVPLVVDRNNVVVAGHTRLKAAERLGMKTVPCVVADDLTPEQVRTFRLVDNRTAEYADWDLEKMRRELDELGTQLDGFGFDDLKELVMPNVVEDIDDIDVPETPTTQIGDVYQLGEHVLMCGDATSKSDTDRLLGEEEVDLYVTDPPYGVDYTGRTEDKLTIINDNLEDQELSELLRDAFANAEERMKKGASFYIWHSENKGTLFLDALDQTSLLHKQTLVWVKNVATLGRQDYQWKHEPCLYGWKRGGAHYFVEDRTLPTVIDCLPNLKKMTKEELVEWIQSFVTTQEEQTTILREDKPVANRMHPTMKPVKLIARIIFNSTVAGDIVLDNFGGSGSTLIACEQLGRRARLMEFDPKYCDAIIQRWEEFTGEKAVKRV